MSYKYFVWEEFVSSNGLDICATPIGYDFHSAEEALFLADQLTVANVGTNKYYTVTVVRSDEDDEESHH